MIARLKNRYERRNPVMLIAMGCIDLFCWLISRLLRWAPVEPSRPIAIRKILLINPAHMGDVVISTAAIRRVKQWDPSIKVGFVTGSWAKDVLYTHPGVDDLYIVDHWRLNRSSQSWLWKWCQYLKTWFQVQRVLVRASYDVAILLNGFSPNLAALVWSSRIPIRGGYVSAGLSTLLNVVLAKPVSSISEQAIQLRLLDEIGIHGVSEAWLPATLLIRERKEELGVRDSYVVLHPGTGNPAKMWALDHWQEVARLLGERGAQIIVTGHGEREKQLAEQIILASDGLNLVGRLKWSDWLAILSEASVVVGVDSVVGHVCTAIGVPFVGVYSGVGSASRWAPVGKKVRVLTKTMACSPCHTKPCVERPCIMSVSSFSVITAVNELFGKNNVHSL